MLLRPIELEITPEEPFKNDSFERQEIIKTLAALIEKLSGPYVIAVDSPWGTGKTTFIRMAKAYLEQKQHPCMYFNAWETDFAEDPLIAFVGELDGLMESVCPDEKARQDLIGTTKKIAGAVAKRTLPALLKIATIGALDAQKEIESIAAELAGGLTGDAVEKYLEDKAQIAAFHSELAKTLKAAEAFKKNLPVVIFIDELDRCRPTYAIELLERVKHLFNVKNVVFIVAIDKKQLGISLSTVYGTGFNATDYLRRFFDMDLRLTRVDSEKFCESLMLRMGFAEQELGEAKKTISEMAKIMQLSPRAQEQYVSTLMLAIVSSESPNAHTISQLAILSSLKVGDENAYYHLTRNRGSVIEIAEFIKQAAKSAGYLDSYFLSQIEHLCLAADQYRDQNVRSRIEHAYEKAETSIPTRNQSRELLEVLDFSACSRSLQLKTLVKKIDLAAQFRTN